MLPIIKKIRVILKSKCVNTWEFLQSLGRELKVMMIMPLKKIFYSAITHLILKISQFLTNNNDFKVMFMKSFLTYGYHAALNKKKQYLPLELFDS